MGVDDILPAPASRVRWSKVLRSRAFRASMAGLVLIIATLALVNLAYFGIDGELSNTDKEVSVLEAVDAGEHGTLVLWYDQGYRQPPYQHSVLDAKGGYAYGPGDLSTSLGDYSPRMFEWGRPVHGWSRTVPTEEGPITFYIDRGQEGSHELFGQRLDPASGSYSGPVSVDGTSPVETMDFDVASSGNDVHVLSIGLINRTEGHNGSNAFYFGSDDSGGSWSSPHALLPPPWQVSKGFLVCHGNEVAVLLVGADDWTGPSRDLRTWHLGSGDGGATWTDPLECDGAEQLEDVAIAHGTIDEDGSVLLVVDHEDWYYDDPPQGQLVRVQPNGTVVSLPHPRSMPHVDMIGHLHDPPSMPLFFEDPSTGTRSVFVFGSDRRTLRHLVLDLDGNVRDSHDIPVEDRGLGISIPTRYEDGWVYGIGTEDFTAGHCAVWTVSEIHYLRTNVETGETELLGMPYVIRERYTEEERDAFADRSIILMGLLVVTTAGLLLVNLHAWRHGAGDGPTEEERRRSRRLTSVAGLALGLYLLVCLAWSLGSGADEALTLAFLGGYYMLAVLLVELPAAHLEMPGRLRHFHLVTATTGMGIMMTATLDASDVYVWYLSDLLWPLVFLQWFSMLGLTLFVSARAIQVARGDGQYLRRVGICSATFILLLLMPWMIVSSVPVWG